MWPKQIDQKGYMPIGSGMQVETPIRVSCDDYGSGVKEDKIEGTGFPQQFGYGALWGGLSRGLRKTLVIE
jgi:hypothetical protein